MVWSSLDEFLEMGGYGLYVWGSYGMSAVALAWEALMLVQARRRALEDLREELAASPVETRRGSDEGV
jgi:heme exporter protein D